MLVLQKDILLLCHFTLECFQMFEKSGGKMSANKIATESERDLKLNNHSFKMVEDQEQENKAIN